MPSLREIQQTVSTLWLNRKAREWLVERRKNELPDCLQGAVPEVLNAVDEKGVALYGNLLGYGYSDVMEAVYPYCAKVLAADWDAIVEDYVLRCPPEHYNFNRLCDKFPQYLLLHGQSFLKLYPFLSELADYEWIEMEKVEEDVDVPVYPHEPLCTTEQISSLCPVVNPTLSIRDYKYNIIALSDRLDENRRLPKKIKAERTIVAIYREATTHRCRFAELGETAVRLIELCRSAHSPAPAYFSVQGPIEAGTKTETKCAAKTVADIELGAMAEANTATEPRTKTPGRLQTYQSLVPHIVTLLPEISAQEAVAQFLEVVEELHELGIFVGSVPWEADRALE